MEEVWKDIKSYEGRYQASNLGNIKALKRYVNNNKGKMLRSERILKKNIRQGYYAVKLYKNSKPKNVPIHRIIAKTFLENIDNKPCVNHKDGNKLNNNVKNLEWCTHSENTTHAYVHGLVKISEKQRLNAKKLYKLGNETTKKKVKQYDLNHNFIKEWESMSEAGKNIKIDASAISMVCNGKRKKAGGYIWKYSE